MPPRNGGPDAGPPLASRPVTTPGLGPNRAEGCASVGRRYDAVVERPTERPSPGEQRPTGEVRPGGSARLDRPPGERYGGGRPPPLEPERGGDRGTARALAIASVVGLAGSAVIVALGGVLALSAGLVVVAGAIGWLIGGTLAGGTLGPRRAIAIALAVESVLVGQVGLWLFAIGEGGALGLVDYLAQTWGAVVVAEVAAAGIAASWSAR